MVNRKDGHVMLTLLALLAFFTLADGVLTNLLIAAGIAREFNPVLEPMAGSPMLVLIKTAGTIVCAFILWDVYRFYPRVGKVSAGCFVVIYACIALWNFSLFLMR